MGAILDPIEELKQHSVTDDHFREIDITSRLKQNMEINPYKNTSGYRSFTRKTVMSIVIPCLLLASFTAYAASGHIQILNNKGEVVVKTIDPPASLPVKLSGLLEEYRVRVMSKLQQGELAAYYIKDDYINEGNGYDTLNPVKFEYRPTDYHSYEAFQKEQARTSAPPIKKPDNLPDGVKFAYGQVFPLGPQLYGEERAQYDALKQRLMHQAQSSTSQEKLFVEKLAWSKASNSVVYLSDGKSSTAITITAGYGKKASFTKFPDTSPEKVQLKHMEGIYLQHEANGDLVSWYDPNRSIVYAIMVNVKGLVNKDELLQMAESLIDE
ncbi:hypothetical protein C7121_23230 [Paenibacillus glucanolyticus]|uniref:hypothetical protein n=1 Tax=Paenibacillus TaxID=44249 RepID=UPI0003E26221|nr:MULTISPECIES: hypothetical protein [Paenibacillus]ANA82437.1 hypothetical protein A3958_21765 [Paenibacillus glucanolyticus]AVV58825.1 hypothetical protein C7121_23230 [Paenibacillus glucanolyticus]ETT33860.1 hypothetical protein C169_21588 [Paenibacillus sp. FSL R5-808]MPY17209.1 hypothetical protein [Paenibacillus glucanolyticus]